ncbi:hypothetical protein [Pararhodobacter oceanensis]|uniref:hypothetical protein n=1 Tax=Pararhodobacter oceanensis TaxID=2172121 RepID=UPI003A91DD76
MYPDPYSIFIVTASDGRPMAYKTAQGIVMRQRELIIADADHSSAHMVAHYAGQARQEARAKRAQ